MEKFTEDVRSESYREKERSLTIQVVTVLIRRVPLLAQAQVKHRVVRISGNFLFNRQKLGQYILQFVTWQRRVGLQQHQTLASIQIQKGQKKTINISSSPHQRTRKHPIKALTLGAQVHGRYPAESTDC